MCKFFAVFNAKTKMFYLVEASELNAWKQNPDIVAIEPCETASDDDYMSASERINVFLAKKAGFLPCTGRQRSLIALYHHNAKTSKAYRKAPTNAHTIELLLQSILDGLMYIRYFDGKWAFQCVSAEDYVMSHILAVDIKSITVNPQELEF